MKNNEFSGDFNKIIIDEGDGAQSDNEKTAAAVNADNTAVPAPQPDDNAALQPPDGAQSASDKPASMPPVKPTTIVLTVLFALLFALGYFFLPYLTQYLPVGGQSVTLNAGVVPADHGFLVKNAVSVVIGRSEKSKVSVSDNTYADGMPLVYTEHTFKVDRVYADAPSGKTDSKTATKTGDGVKSAGTADNFPMASMAAALVLSAGALAVLTVRGRRKEQDAQ